MLGCGVAAVGLCSRASAGPARWLGTSFKLVSRTSLQARPVEKLHAVLGQRSAAIWTGQARPSIVDLLPVQRFAPAFATERSLHSSASESAKSKKGSKKSRQQASPTPEELFPDSFPKDGDLVNPSGPIYAVRRPPDESKRDNNINQPQKETIKDKITQLGTPIKDKISQLRTNPTSEKVSQLRMELTGDKGTHPQENTTNDDRYYTQIAACPKIIASIVWAVVVIIAFYAMAASASVAKTFRAVEVIDNSKRGGVFGDFKSFTREDVSFEGQKYSEERLRAVEAHILAANWGRRLQTVLGWCDHLGFGPGPRKFIERSMYGAVSAYIELPWWKRAVLPVLAINTLIFCAFLSASPIARLQRNFGWEKFMIQRFTHTPSGPHYTMLTAPFSHMHVGHYLLNTIPLLHFGAIALAAPAFYEETKKHFSSGTTLVSEASVTPHYLAFFASSGVLASLASHLYRAVQWRIVVRSQGLARAGRINNMMTLGSSGALMAILALWTMAMPEAKQSIPFTGGFTIRDVFVLFVSIDVLGLVLGWRRIDHMTHIAGAAFGYAYFYYGGAAWEWHKQKFAQSLNEAKQHLREQRAAEAEKAYQK